MGMHFQSIYDYRNGVLAQSCVIIGACRSGNNEVSRGTLHFFP